MNQNFISGEASSNWDTEGMRISVVPDEYCGFITPDLFFLSLSHLPANEDTILK